jgi:hypothetical protein
MQCLMNLVCHFALEVCAGFLCLMQTLTPTPVSCRGLMRSTHQRAGLELMDQMSAHQEAAYEHLCR